MFAQEITKKKGKVTVQYPDGKKEASGKVKNYKKQGTWKYWDHSGKLQKTVTYKDDVMSGLYTEFHNDGTKSLEGNYVNGKKSGTWRSWYIGGKRAYEMNYKDGEQEGVQQWWFDNGQLREQTSYTDGKIDYRWTWYFSGRKKAVEYYRNGLAEGTWRTYPDPSETRDTLPQTIDNFSGGKRNGVHLAYNYGRLSEEIMYKNDKLHGSYKKWDFTGSIGVSENYENGLRHGECKYYNNSRLVRELVYVNGKKHGKEIEYDGRGEQSRVTWYSHDMADSLRKYHPNGELAVSRVYAYYAGTGHAEEVSTYTEWDPAGVKLLTGKYHFETKEGDWTTFYPNGKVKSVTPYRGGKIEGVYRKWYASGKLLIELHCDGNTVMTPPKVWDIHGRPLKPGTTAYEEIVDSSKPGEVYNDPSGYRPNRTVMDPPPLPPVRAGWEAYIYPGLAQEPKLEIRQEPGKKDETVLPEEQPEFPGGTEALYRFLDSSLVYPQLCLEKEIEGRVYIRFVVEKDGSLSDFTELRGVQGCPQFSAEAIRVLSTMPKWTPGKTNGKPVRVAFTIPVKFSLK